MIWRATSAGPYQSRPASGAGDQAPRKRAVAAARRPTVDLTLLRRWISSALCGRTSAAVWPRGGRCPSPSLGPAGQRRLSSVARVRRGVRRRVHRRAPCRVTGPRTAAAGDGTGGGRGRRRRQRARARAPGRWIPAVLHDQTGDGQNARGVASLSRLHGSIPASRNPPPPQPQPPLVSDTRPTMRSNSKTCKRRCGSFNASELSIKGLMTCCKDDGVEGAKSSPSVAVAAGVASAAVALGASRLSLTDLPTQLGIVIVNHMAIEAGPTTHHVPFQLNSGSHPSSANPESAQLSINLTWRRCSRT